MLTWTRAPDSQPLPVFYQELCLLAVQTSHHRIHHLPGSIDPSERTGIFTLFWEIAIAKFRAFSSNFGKRPLAKIGNKMINLTAKLGEIYDIEHNKGSKIYPQNQVIQIVLCQAYNSSIKCLSIILIWVIVSHK